MRGGGRRVGVVAHRLVLADAECPVVALVIPAMLNTPAHISPFTISLAHLALLVAARLLVLAIVVGVVVAASNMEPIVAIQVHTGRLLRPTRLHLCQFKSSVCE